MGFYIFNSVKELKKISDIIKKDVRKIIVFKICNINKNKLEIKLNTSLLSFFKSDIEKIKFIRFEFESCNIEEINIINYLNILKITLNTLNSNIGKIKIDIKGEEGNVGLLRLAVKDRVEFHSDFKYIDEVVFNQGGKIFFEEDKVIAPNIKGLSKKIKVMNKQIIFTAEPWVKLFNVDMSDVEVKVVPSEHMNRYFYFFAEKVFFKNVIFEDMFFSDFVLLRSNAEKLIFQEKILSARFVRMEYLTVEYISLTEINAENEVYSDIEKYVLTAVSNEGAVIIEGIKVHKPFSLDILCLKERFFFIFKDNSGIFLNSVKFICLTNYCELEMKCDMKVKKGISFYSDMAGDYFSTLNISVESKVKNAVKIYKGFNQSSFYMYLNNIDLYILTDDNIGVNLNNCKNIKLFNGGNSILSSLKISGSENMDIKLHNFLEFPVVLKENKNIKTVFYSKLERKTLKAYDEISSEFFKHFNLNENIFVKWKLYPNNFSEIFNKIVIKYLSKEKNIKVNRALWFILKGYYHADIIKKIEKFNEKTIKALKNNIKLDKLFEEFNKIITENNTKKEKYLFMDYILFLKERGY